MFTEGSTINIVDKYGLGTHIPRTFGAKWPRYPPTGAKFENRGSEQKIVRNCASWSRSFITVIFLPIGVKYLIIGAKLWRPLAPNDKRLGFYCNDSDFSQSSDFNKRKRKGWFFTSFANHANFKGQLTSKIILNTRTTPLKNSKCMSGCTSTTSKKRTISKKWGTRKCVSSVRFHRFQQKGNNTRFGWVCNKNRTIHLFAQRFTKNNN